MWKIDATTLVPDVPDSKENFDPDWCAFRNKVWNKIDEMVKLGKTDGERHYSPMVINPDGTTLIKITRYFIDETSAREYSDWVQENKPINSTYEITVEEIY